MSLANLGASLHSHTIFSYLPFGVQEEAEQEYEVIKVACCNTAGSVASTFGKYS